MALGGHAVEHVRWIALAAVGAVLVAACTSPVGTAGTPDPGSGGESQGSTTSVAVVDTTMPVPLTVSTTPAEPAGVEADEGQDVGAQGSEAEEPFVPLNLEVGTCFNDPPADTELVTPDSLVVVDCAIEHDNEVFGNFQVDAETFPGPAEIQVMSDKLCFSAFETYIGEPYDTSIFDFSWYFPTPESWAVGGTNIICFAYSIEMTKISGSIYEVGR